jgi:glutamate N-acetyltransferase/amino-acid N-acetyltransferase
MKIISGGVCAPKGFKAAGIYCGIRKNQSKKDLALIVSEKRAAAACVYTTNLVKGAPIIVTRRNVSDGYAQAIIANSGNANTCNANGEEIATGMCALVEKHAGIPAADVIVASTGVIGEPLSLEPMEKAMPALMAALGDDSDGAAAAIMTTDTIKKEIAVEFELSGVVCRIGAIAKGSGMIHPNMATMLAFITTDVSISPEMLQKALSEDVKDSFNMISVDGDTSTNDMAAILANGLAGNPVIDSEGDDYETFRAALSRVTSYLCQSIARDGEGATKLLRCTVQGAASKAAAAGIAKAIIRSPLVKCAMFGADANWGRVLCAIGYSGERVDVNKVALSFSSSAGEVEVCRNGRGMPFSEELAKKVLSREEITIAVTLGDGGGAATAYGCDLSYDYVRINGDYRS